MSVLMFVLPAVVIILLSLPLVKALTGKVSASSVKMRMLLHVCGFFGAIGLTLLLSIATSPVFAEGIDGTMAQGLGFISAALVTAVSSVAAAIAISAAAPAAIGAFSENPENFGKALIFVALGEGIAIYGLLISILIINNL